MNPVKKKDPSVTYLNKLGYNVVKLPRTGIEPMDVIGRDQTVQWLGAIDAIWNSAVPKPQPGPPKPASACPPLPSTCASCPPPRKCPIIALATVNNNPTPRHMMYIWISIYLPGSVFP